MDYCHVKAFKFLILGKIFTKINIYKQYDHTVIHVIAAQKYRHLYIYKIVKYPLFIWTSQWDDPIEFTFDSTKIIICPTRIVFI